jgi:lipopolysaccharide transport system ATP-binding protein
LVPNFHFFTEDGTYAFILHDTDPEWRRKPKPVGEYRSTAYIPGNFLSEGVFFVGVAITTYNPFRVHVYERDAIAFRIIDAMTGRTARGDYTGHIPGVIRPLLPWSTTPVPGPVPG